MDFLIFAQSNPSNAPPDITNMWQFLYMALMPTFAFLTSLATLILAYLNNKKSSEKQDVMVAKQHEIAENIDGLTDARVKSEGESRYAEGLNQGGATEQKRVAVMKSDADAAAERLEEIRGHKPVD